MHEMIHGFSTAEEGEQGLLPIHVVYFAYHKDFKKIPPKTFFKNLEDKLIPIYGKFEVIKKLKKISQEKLEPYFFVLHSILGTKIQTLSKRDEKAAIESLLKYLKQKYNIILKERIPETEKQKEGLFIKIMQKLDKVTYRNAEKIK